MRSIALTGSRAALGVALGAALAGLVALGGASGVWAQGMMMMDSPKAAPAKGAPKAAKPAPRVKKRFYRAPAARTCGQFKYWSKGKCLDARTTPPKL
jgi:hypothetical protein